MTSRTSRALPSDQITAALGGVALPGDLGDFARGMAEPKRNVLRCRRGILPEELPLATLPVPWYHLGQRPTIQSPGPSRFLAYAAADYYVQDAGSLLALAAVGADTAALGGLLVCDLCAAPGGKASALVEAIAESAAEDGGFVLANEPVRSRLGALQLNLARTGSDRYAVSNRDPDALADRLPGLFDVVVVDAPCSGQALMARGRQKVSSLSANQIQHSASRQRRILDAALRLLRDGGRLVYSTCTFAEAENESQVDRLVTAGAVQPQSLDRLALYETTEGCYRLWPHLHDCGGSFAASMTVTRRERIKDRRCRRRDDEKMPIDLAQWYGALDTSVRLSRNDSVILAWPDDAPDWVDEIAAGGPELAHRVGQTWRPSHAAALRRTPRGRSCQSLEVNDQTAKRYLHGEPIACQGEGWHVVRLRSRPLGWVKGDGSIGKNHLPAAARTMGELAT